MVFVGPFAENFIQGLGKSRQRKNIVISILAKWSKCRGNKEPIEIAPYSPWACVSSHLENTPAFWAWRQRRGLGIVSCVTCDLSTILLLTVVNMSTRWCRLDCLWKTTSRVNESQDREKILWLASRPSDPSVGVIKNQLKLLLIVHEHVFQATFKIHQPSEHEGKGRALE